MEIETVMNGRLALLFLAFTAGLLIISKVFLFPDCYSFDSHDDANHAFPYNHVARQAISSGEIPSINYFNNFGAPILGDALTYPFAIQAITYSFVSGPIGMTINRFLIALLTIFSAFYFFRIYLTLFPSLVCSLLILFNPVSFWYPVHQYQMATPLFFISIMLMNKLIDKKLTRYFVALSILFCILVLSVSINLVLFMLPFFVTWSFCRNKFKLDRYFIAPLVAFASGLIFFYPQTFDFIRNYLTSARVDEGVYYGILGSARELFLGVAIPPGEWIPYNYGAHLQAISYISITVILMVLASTWLIRKEESWKQLSIFLCGIVPTVIALFLYINSELRFIIPLVKSVDILRVLWFSMPFCLVYVGFFLRFSEEGKITRPISLFILLLSLISILILKFIPESSNINPLFFVTILFMAAGAFILLITKRSRFASILFLVSLMLVPVPIIVRILGLYTKSCGGTQYSNNLTQSKFAPYGLVEYMEKGNRVATEIHTHKGHDLRIAQDGILGSDARGIAIDKKFGKYLEGKNLVFVDQVPYGYYFSRPWQTDELTKLGIRYLIVELQTDKELEDKNWQKLATIENHSLYENPNKPTPIYLKKDQTITFIKDYNFHGNHISVNLPKISSPEIAVITILNKYGFEAKVDGNYRDIVSLDSGLISLGVLPGDKQNYR